MRRRRLVFASACSLLWLGCATVLGIGDLDVVNHDDAGSTRKRDGSASNAPGDACDPGFILVGDFCENPNTDSGYFPDGGDFFDAGDPGEDGGTGDFDAGDNG